MKTCLPIPMNSNSYYPKYAVLKICNKPNKGSKSGKVCVSSKASYVNLAKGIVVKTRQVRLVKIKSLYRSFVACSPARYAKRYHAHEQIHCLRQSWQSFKRENGFGPMQTARIRTATDKAPKPAKWDNVWNIRDLGLKVWTNDRIVENIRATNMWSWYSSLSTKQPFEAKTPTSNPFQNANPILPLMLESFFSGLADFYLLDPFGLKHLMGCQATDWVGIKNRVNDIATLTLWSMLVFLG